jgi:hypothetical protein
MSADGGELDKISDALEEIAEQLADLALECLRRAAQSDEPKPQLTEERRIRRARSAVLRASATLRGAAGEDDQP